MASPKASRRTVKPSPIPKGKKPFGTTTFCDDIRQEVGGKLTFVGVYTEDMVVVTDELPAMLPTFATHTRIMIPGDMDVSEVSFRLVAEHDGKTEDIFRGDSKAVVMPKPPDDGEAKLLVVNINAGVSPLVIRGSCLMRAIATINGEEVVAGTLNVRVNPPSAANSQPKLAKQDVATPRKRRRDIAPR